MMDLKAALGAAMSAAFQALGLPAELGRVTVSTRPDLADFQCNGAMAAGKLLRRDPREIASRVIEHLAAQGLARAELAGLGFINLRVTETAISDRMQAISADPKLGGGQVAVPRMVIVDYAGPNVAKPMHVGHLRASIIGELIKRLYRFRGDTVKGDAHFGDWGFQMGLLLVAVTDEVPEVRSRVLELDQAGRPGDGWSGGPLPFEGLVDLAMLDRLYPLAATKAKTDEAYRDRARRATAQLQAGSRPGYQALWQQFVVVSRTALQREFKALNVSFDLWNGESDVQTLVDPMVEALTRQGLAVPDQGAVIVRVARAEDKRELPPLLLVSSEGSAMYGTTDVATILDRRRRFDPQLMLYCVDQRQADHFEQVFRVACLAGYAEPDQLEHIGFGTMNGPDGKPFKTREGGVLKLNDLIEMAREKARDRLREAGLGSELSAEDFEDTAHKVGVAALKFADLSNHRMTSYVFDLDRFTSFEGKTGPYLLYQAVRVKSLLRKAGDHRPSAGQILISDLAEREVALVLDGFESAVTEAYDKKAPNLVAEHAYRLAQAFSRFYAACPILVSEDERVKASRLELATLCLRQLECSLDLLGIAVPDRM